MPPKKKIAALVKVQLQAGSATPAPPVGTALAAGLSKGSGVPHKDKVGKLTKDQVREIATTKLPDLNANDIDAAMKIVEGTARSMGVTTD
jgi:large subunit ribosomal protein L11